MENLPADVRRKIALDLPPADFVNLCLARKAENRDICESESFWRMKLERDYLEEFLDFYRYGTIVTNPKEKYIRNFKRVSTEIENFVNEFIIENYGSRFIDYFTQKYKDDLYKAISSAYYKYLEYLKNNVENEDVSSELVESEVSDLVLCENDDEYGKAVEFIDYLIINNSLATAARREITQRKAAMV